MGKLVKITEPSSEKVEEATETFVPNPIRLEKREVQTLNIGAEAPDFKLPASDGTFYELADFKAAKALCIIFTCNHCPTAQAYEDRVVQISKDYKDKGVGLMAISPNSDAALPYTILVEPKGKVVYSIQDTIDPLALKKTIVEHPMIGRYY